MFSYFQRTLWDTGLVEVAAVMDQSRRKIEEHRAVIGCAQNTSVQSLLKSIDRMMKSSFRNRYIFYLFLFRLINNVI